MPRVQGIHAAAKWMRAFNQGWILAQSILQKMSGQGVWTHPSMVLLAMVQRIRPLPFFLSQIAYLSLCVKALLYSVRSSAPLFNGGKTFWLVMMSLRWWQNHHHPAGGCQKSWEMTCHHFYPFALQAVECGLWQAVWGDSAWLYVLRLMIQTILFEWSRASFG